MTVRYWIFIIAGGTAVLGLALPVIAADRVPLTWEESLFDRPATIDFVQRSVSVKEWEIQHRKDEGGKRLDILVQVASSENVALKTVEAQMLFPYFFKEALTEDADTARATLGESGIAEMWDGKLSYASARELEEVLDVLGAFEGSTRAGRGPNWNDCVIFTWTGHRPPAFMAGCFCHVAPGASRIMTAPEALEFLNTLQLRFLD